jgi:hypothetical protein
MKLPQWFLGVNGEKLPFFTNLHFWVFLPRQYCGFWLLLAVGIEQVCELNPVFDRCFLKDVVDVVIYSLNGDEELVRDILVFHTRHDALDYFGFPFRYLV